MLTLGTGKPRSSWTTPVLAVSSVSGEHMQTLKTALDDHWSHLQTSGEFAERQRSNCRNAHLSIQPGTCSSSSSMKRAGDLERQLQAVVSRETDPRTAANVLLGLNQESQK